MNICGVDGCTEPSIGLAELISVIHGGDSVWVPLCEYHADVTRRPEIRSWKWESRKEPV